MNVVRFDHTHCAGNAPRGHRCVPGPEIYVVEHLVEQPGKCRIEKSEGVETEKFRNRNVSVPIVGLDSREQLNIRLWSSGPRLLGYMKSTGGHKVLITARGG